MRSALELDTEVRRLRQSMRRLLGGLTLALVVGVGVIAAVVGASLTAADKEALQAFNGGAQTADAAKINPAKTAKADARKDVRQPPARETTGQAPAAPQPPAAAPQPPASTAAAPPPPPASTAPPPPASASTAAGPAAPPTAPTSTAAAPQAPAAAPDQRRAAEPKRQPQRQKQIARTQPADDAKRDANGGEGPRDATAADRAREQAPADSAVRERGSNRRYVRVRPSDQDRTRAPEAGPDRERVVVIERGSGYAPRAEPEDAPRETRRDSGRFGLFGALFGLRPDRGEE